MIQVTADEDIRFIYNSECVGLPGTEHENDLLVVQYISTTLWYYTTQIHANYLPLHHDIILRKYMQIHMMAQSYFAFSTKPY